jgi:hypothetical protein
MKSIIRPFAALLLLAAVEPAAAQTPGGWNRCGPFIAYGRARPVYVAPPSFTAGAAGFLNLSQSPAIGPTCSATPERPVIKTKTHQAQPTALTTVSAR